MPQASVTSKEIFPVVSPFTKLPPGDPSIRLENGAASSNEVLSEELFQRMISLERKRSERTQRPFVLLLIDAGRILPAAENSRVLLEILAALQAATRETDTMGWHAANSVVGVIFTEITLDNKLILSTILARISNALRDQLTSDQLGQVKFSFHLFPEEWDPDNPERQSNPALYPDLRRRNEFNRLGRVIKRTMDIVGGILLLALLSPVFLIIAAAIKLTSRGPVLFRQQRIGERGVPFTFFKFRSMYANNDASEHQEYVRQLIAGQAVKHPTNGNGNGNDGGIFKLTDDPRITPVGSFLRRTSLDELPQLINVLQGEMSLVGPRPPVPYEVEAYALWHRRRLFEAKPGITGLWQVHGRSRVGFDDMVRLDLRYARDCSPWLDLKILLQTPRAVIGGNGAC
jgi:lipopolysaccharide/colanic/teichoic acid biosynthesis glycosyltransferase